MKKPEDSRKIIFTNPPALKREGLKARGMFPLPLIALANALEDSIEVEQASPDLLISYPDIKSVISKSSAGWVAITCYQETMDQVREIAQIAKSSGKKVIAGGHHITLWKGNRVLREIPEIDFVIEGEGELPLKMLIEGSDFKRIPGLWWRSNGVPVTNKLPLYVCDWTNQPPMVRGYSAFDYSEIWKIHKTMGRTKYQKPFSIMGLRGCGYAIRSKNRCSFCAMPIASCQLRCRKPKYFWDEIMWARSRYNIDFLWDHSDSLLGSPEWLRGAADFRPDDAPPIWCYGRADEIRENTIKPIDALRIEHIYIGVEVGSNKRLKEMKKGITLQQVMHAIGLCQKYGIRVQLSFIIGLPGETPVSLGETFDFAMKCYEIGVDDIVFHEFILRKGLKWFDYIANQYPDMNRVVLDQGRLQKIFWHLFNPKVNREIALESAKEIVALFPNSELTAWNI